MTNQQRFTQTFCAGCTRSGHTPLQAITNDIDPRLAELRRQTADYTRYNQLSREVDEKGKIWNAYVYYIMRRELEAGGAAHADATATIAQLKAENKRMARETQELDEKLMSAAAKGQEDAELEASTATAKEARDVRNRADRAVGEAEKLVVRTKKEIESQRERIEVSTKKVADTEAKIAEASGKAGDLEKIERELEAAIAGLEQRKHRLATGTDDGAADEGKTWQQSLNGESLFSSSSIIATTCADKNVERAQVKDRLKGLQEE